MIFRKFYVVDLSYCYKSSIFALGWCLLNTKVFVPD